MKIAIGSDHAGFELKEIIKEYFIDNDIAYKDFGPFSDESVDYPDFGHAVARALKNNSFDFGVVICGSGNGINMTVNKYEYVRAALCWDTELAELARLHNNANILTLPARFLKESKGLEILKTFLKTQFEGGRHERRINKIAISC